MNHPIYIYSIIVISYQPQYYLTLIFDIQSSITFFAQRDSWFPTVFETAVATKISKRNDVSVAHGRNGVHQVEYQTFAAGSPVVARGKIGQAAARVVSDGVASDRSIAIGKM